MRKLGLATSKKISYSQTPTRLTKPIIHRRSILLSHRIASLILLEGFTDHPNPPYRVEDLVAAGDPIFLPV